MTCSPAISGDKIVGVYIGKTLVLFENQEFAEDTMRTMYQSEPNHWVVQAEAAKIAEQSRRVNDKVVEEILEVIGKHRLFPVPMG